MLVTLRDLGWGAASCWGHCRLTMLCRVCLHPPFAVGAARLCLQRCPAPWPRPFSLPIAPGGPGWPPFRWRGGGAVAWSRSLISAHVHGAFPVFACWSHGRLVLVRLSGSRGLVVCIVFVLSSFPVLFLCSACLFGMLRVPFYPLKEKQHIVV